MTEPLGLLHRLGAFDEESGALQVIVETPRGSRNKYKYDERRGLFTVSGVLPAGAVFPFDFGFVPATRGGDGDPLDVLVLMDEPAFPGCLIHTRLIGVLEAEQREGRHRERNDRLIAVAEGSHAFRNVHMLRQVSPDLLHEIEHFFISYNQMRGRRFIPRGRFGPLRARRIVVRGQRAF